MSKKWVPTYPTRPFWREDEYVDQDATSSSISEAHCDVVVIGAGMSGVSCAFHLAQEGVDVVLVDARKTLCDGATGRNGGFVHAHGFDMIPLMLRKRSFSDAYGLVRLERAGRALIRDLVREHKIGCDLYQDIDAFEVYDDESAMRARLGLWSNVNSFVSFVSNIDLIWNRDQLRQELNVNPTSSFCAAVVSRSSCDTFWAKKFVRNVAERATHHFGLRSKMGTRVVCIDDSLPSKLSVVFEDGKRVACEKVVCATNAWTPSLLPEMTGCIVPVRNHVLATAPISRLSSREDRPCVGFSCRGGFVYGMQREDGRVVLGGFRDTESDGSNGVEKWDDSSYDESVFEEMRTFLAKHFDIVEDEIAVEAQWTGIIGWSCDDTPWVGGVPGRENVFVCAGFSGHGMCQAFLCGAFVAEMVMGNPNPALFVESFRPDFSRKRTADYSSGHTSDAEGG
eukprot:g1754.t1